MLAITDLRCPGHRVPSGFPERPLRVERVVAALDADPRFTLRAASPRADDELLDAVHAVHDPQAVARFERAVRRREGLVDTADNPISDGSYEAALGAVAASLDALDAALGAERRAFAAIRPPGHHAERDRAMGFCFFNQAAIVAERARTACRIERVAIVDVDVHHGNGTQHLFEQRADVFYASLHQFPFYPGTGAASERGHGAGAGATLNLPLAAGTGDPEWCAALASSVVPALERFAPELLVVSAGFDAWRNDPLGGCVLSEEGFAELGRTLFDFAERRCAGRAVVLLEGGYDVEALPRLVTSFLLGSAQRR